MENTKLSIKGIALASAILWGFAVLVVGLANMKWAGYGSAFLGVVSSVYPGYGAEPTIPSVATGALYGALDGGIGGGIFAFIYNLFRK